MNKSEIAARASTDTEMLDWLVFYSGTVITSRDGEDAWVEWYAGDEEENKQTTRHLYRESSARDAIQEAMRREEAHDYR